ncbi:hypothetical protein KIN20_018372 [Parelaphostrongylus tenuis]|uniref:Uncharacterized protein n=1 Tax=Parelaphostrongylus tenuis TaxID=148309 RepID=A0AAD5MMX5_PARTN|nr:hypothetical protein KIN20_018372 [Parelaphostrongylus tenuis]
MEKKDSINFQARSMDNKQMNEGQHLDDSVKLQVPDDADCMQRFMIQYRKYIAFLFPVVIMQTLWWLTAIRYEWLALFETHWHMPLIMVLGALVAGMTSEGGGASVGMMCALFVIVFMQVQIEQRAVLFGTIGSIPGLVFGFEVFDPLLDAAQKKMLFVSIWASFAIAYSF